MIELNLSSEIFNSIYIPYLTDDTDEQIFFGGESAGKSVFVAQRSVTDIERGNRNYLVIRNVARDNRESTFKQICQIIRNWNIDEHFHIIKNPLEITSKLNGRQILFAGLDDVERLKSIVPLKGVITDIWEEEATEISYDDDKLLSKRLRGRSAVKKRRIKTFNPIAKTHWIYEKYFGDWKETDTSYRDSKLTILKTTYKDNKFLTEQDIARIEGETDEYYYQVYTLGMWGVLGKLIFNNWKIEDLSILKNTFSNFRNGLDFGYSNDPAAFSRSHFEQNDKKIYVFDDLPYAKELTNPDISEQIKPKVQDEMVYCDSSEPKSIKELKNNGIRAYPCIKGKDSLLHGIQWLQQHEIIIDKNCQNAINEMKIAQWQKNKDGEYINKPVDRKNHFISALRYSFSRDMFNESQAYFYTEINSIKSQNRIKNIPIESASSVYTFWGFGEDKSIAIWFVQLSEREVKNVNCYSNIDLPFVHYVNYIKDWRDSHLVTYEKHIFPYYAKDKTQGTEKSIYQIAKEYNLKCGFARKPASEIAGIEIMRQFFSRCWFDKENCVEGLEALTLFRKSYDSINEIGGSKPVQDWTVKYAKAFQTMALYLQKDPEKEDYARVLTLDGRTGGEYSNPENAWMR